MTFYLFPNLIKFFFLQVNFETGRFLCSCDYFSTYATHAIEIPVWKINVVFTNTSFSDISNFFSALFCEFILTFFIFVAILSFIFDILLRRNVSFYFSNKIIVLSIIYHIYYRYFHILNF